MATVGKPPIALRQTPASRAALHAARRACRGKQPAQVIATSLPAARRRGAPTSLIDAATRASKPDARGPQPMLAAGAVYAWSLPKSDLADAARGCVYELRRTLNSTSSKGSSR
jgi:hypothetical protein